MKRVEWAYEAELDYINEVATGEWMIGFLDQEGTPYECPHTTDEPLVRRLEKLRGIGKRLKVTVEVDEKPDAAGMQHPKLIDVCVIEE